jgi:tripartite-type tricarboxylate transporter receptor subunit TctC
MKRSLLLGAAIVFSVLLGSAVCGGEFPERELTFIHWNGPGSSGDTVVRTLCKAAEPHFGQPIKIVTRTGGNSVNALNMVLKEPADGYTISFFSASLSGFMNMPGFTPKPEDFDPLVRALQKSYMLCVNTKLPINNVKEFIDYAKKHPNEITISGTRIGSIHHQNLFFMIKEAGVKVNYLPCKGGGAAMKEALGGHVNGVVYAPHSMLPHVKKGTLRPLVIFSHNRDPNYSETPTIQEAGFKMEPIYQVNGVMLKKGVPADRRFKIFDAFSDALEDPEWKAYVKKAHHTTRMVLPDDLTANFLRETEAAKGYLKEIGVVQ